MLAIKSCEVSLLHSKAPRISSFGTAIFPFQRAVAPRHLSSNKHEDDEKKKKKKKKCRELVISACGGEKENRERKTFLSLEEAGLVEISGLSTHERFLCRLTISSLNLLRVISEQEGLPIEELNAGRVCDWFIKDKLKRDQKLGSAVLQWGDDESQLQI